MRVDEGINSWEKDASRQAASRPHLSRHIAAPRGTYAARRGSFAPRRATSRYLSQHVATRRGTSRYLSWHVASRRDTAQHVAGTGFKYFAACRGQCRKRVVGGMARTITHDGAFRGTPLAVSCDIPRLPLRHPWDAAGCCRSCFRRKKFPRHTVAFRRISRQSPHPSLQFTNLAACRGMSQTFPRYVAVCHGIPRHHSGDPMTCCDIP